MTFRRRRAAQQPRFARLWSEENFQLSYDPVGYRPYRRRLG
jgi:hypothetical protein